MALIPPFFLDCVLAIGFADAAGNVRYVATGFLYGRAVFEGRPPEETEYRVYVITNRHVLEGQTKAFLRFNPATAQPARVYGIDLLSEANTPLWTAHEDHEVDLAAIGINVNVLHAHEIQFGFFLSNHHVLSREKALELGITEGDGVFILGFPLGEVGKERSYVVVRQGAIARIRDALAGATKDFLVDASIFPGNSGGPVVTRPEITAIQGTKSNSSAFLVGVVSGYVPYQDVAISQQTRRPRVIFEENSGLAAIVPVDRVLEVVEQAEEKLQPQPATPAEPEQRQG